MARFGTTRRYIRWTDKEVIGWAEEYVNTQITLEGLEAKIDVSHSTLWWNFVHRLPLLDADLHELVMLTFDSNKHSKVKREEVV